MRFTDDLSSLDYYFTCPTNYFAQKFAEHGMKVYYYHFTQVCHRLWLNGWKRIINGSLWSFPRLCRDRVRTRGANGWVSCTPMRSSTSLAIRSTCRVITQPASVNSVDEWWSILPPSRKRGKSHTDFLGIYSIFPPFLAYIVCFFFFSPRLKRTLLGTVVASLLRETFWWNVKTNVIWSSKEIEFHKIHL